MRDPEEGVDEHGFIVTGVRADRVPEPFQPIVHAAMSATAEHTACSLYLYGSVATGMALSPSSDVDLLTVGLDADVASSIAQSLSEQFRDRCRSVDVAVVEPADLRGDTCPAYGTRVFLRHYCAHLHGPAIHTRLPRFPADQRAARAFNGDIDRHAQQWRGELDGTSVGRDGPLARRMARKTLLALAGLVSIHDGIWTTDREWGVRRWSEIEPDRADELDMLHAWSTGLPEVEARDVGAALDGVVGHVIVRFREAVGLWADG